MGPGSSLDSFGPRRPAVTLSVAAAPRRGLLATKELRRLYESIHCGRVCSIIVYSVRIGPPQLETIVSQLVPRTPQPSELTICLTANIVKTPNAMLIRGDEYICNSFRMARDSGAIDNFLTRLYLPILLRHPFHTRCRPLTEVQAEAAAMRKKRC
jgi:hypothetical protein